MKKFFATILAIIYLSTSVGATIHLHYCMGRLISWGLTANDSKECTFCGMPKNSTSGYYSTDKDGCCRDEYKNIKIDKDQKATESCCNFLSLSFNTVSDNFPNLPETYVASGILGHPSTNAPPGPLKVALFLRNRNFRI